MRLSLPVLAPGWFPLLLVMSAAGWAAEPVRLDVSQSVALAAARSPSLAGRAAAVEAAAHRVGAATGRLLPRLSVGLRYVRLSPVAPGQISLPFSLPGQPAPDPIVLGETIENQFGSSVVLEQPLVTGLSLLNTRQAAQSTREAAEEQLAWERQDLALRTEEAYFAVLRARQLLTVTDQSARALTAHLERLDRLEREGATTALDVARTRTRVATTRVQQLQARAAEAVAEQALLVLLGLAADSTLELTENLDAAPAAVEGDLQARAATRPDLRAARALAEAKEAQARAAAGSLWPQLMLRASAQYDSPNQRYFPLKNAFNPSWDAAVTFSWTAWDWLATWHTHRAAALEAVAARQSVAQQEDGVRTEVERRRLEAATSQEREGATLEAVAVAEQALGRAARLCDAGQAPCIWVLDAEAELTRLRADHVQSRLDSRLASSQLRRSVGALSPLH
jgi:outer membrane protein